MNTTEQPPTPRELRETIMEKLAGLPAGVDANGRHDQDRAADAAQFDRLQGGSDFHPEPPVQVGMKPNPMQGRGSATVPTPAPTDPLAAIRAQLNHTNAL